VKGTHYFLSPEIMKKKGRDKSFIDLYASDMWALGVTIYYCLYFRYPFSTNSAKEYKMQVIDENYQITYPEVENEYKVKKELRLILP